MVREQKRTVRICTAILLALVALTLLPIALLVVSSFMDEKEILNNGYSLFPEKWSIDAYLYMIPKKLSLAERIVLLCLFYNAVQRRRGGLLHSLDKISPCERHHPRPYSPKLSGGRISCDSGS